MASRSRNWVWEALTRLQIVIINLRSSDRMEPRLVAARSWLTAHGSAITGVVLVLVGVVVLLIGVAR